MSMGTIRRVDDDDDNQSYLSLKQMSAAGKDYSDVESSGNIIRISSKQSESSYLISESN